jgi:hypothetical protein
MPSLNRQRRSDTQIATNRRLEDVRTDKPRLITPIRNPAPVKPTSAAEIGDQIAAPAPPKTEEYDPRATARGVLVGLVIGIVLWAVIGFAAWYLL